MNTVNLVRAIDKIEQAIELVNNNEPLSDTDCINIKSIVDGLKSCKHMTEMSILSRIKPKSKTVFGGGTD